MSTTVELVRANERYARLRAAVEALRHEVIAVVAEGLWDGDSDYGQPDYDRIAALYDEAAYDLRALLAAVDS